MLTMGSLFDGSGGFPLAGAMSGITTKWASEIEDFPVRLTTKRFPKMKHLGDICKINGFNIEPVDVVTGGSPCFVESTLIKTNRGLIPIKNVKVGDYVLTHENHMRKVIETMVRDTDSVYEMKAFGFPVIYATEDHPFLIINKLTKEASWKKLKNLDQFDYIAIPVNRLERVNSLNLTRLQCWLLGQFFANGRIRDFVRFFVSENQFLIYEEEIKKNPNIFVVENSIDSDGDVGIIISPDDSQTFELCKKINEKRRILDLPRFVFELPDDLLLAFVSGAVGVSESDLVTSEKTAKFMATLSVRLVLQFQEFMIRLFNKIFKCQYEHYDKDDATIFYNDILWTKFEYAKIVDIYSTVYNLEVEDDHSYTANGLAAHNCQDMSLAGNRKGMKYVCPKCKTEFDISTDAETCSNCGAPLEKTRSGLFVEQIRIIKEMRKEQEERGIPRELIKPRFFVWENVSGAFSSNKGEDFRQVLCRIISVVEEQFDVPQPSNKGSGTKWGRAGTILGNGWSIAWRQFDAQYWGVPQRRRRVYLVADFGGYSAAEVLFECEGLSGNHQTRRIAWQEITRNFGKSFEQRNNNGCLPRETKKTEYLASQDDISEIDQIYLNMKECNVDFNKMYWQKESSVDEKAYGFDGWKSHMSDICFNENVSPCLCTVGRANVLVKQQEDCEKKTEEHKRRKCYGISAVHSNAMLSDNPNSGIFETDISRTLDLNGGNPACNQGGIMVVEPVYCLQGSMIGRQEKNGPQGNGINENVSFTLNTIDRHAVAIPEEQVGDENCVRRFTPLECCRLQGFPDWWCDDVEHYISSEYKMWGNGIALPNAYFVLSRIADIMKSTRVEMNQDGCLSAY